MKVITIRQPFASLICSGLKDVENRSWQITDTPRRILIHSGATMHRCNFNNMPLLWWLMSENCQTMGKLPEQRDLPMSAIIGVATVVECVTESNSPWAGAGHGAEYKWVMTDVRTFKRPITGVKGKLGMFDYDLDGLPECVDIPDISLSDDGVLEMPLNDKLFNDAERRTLKTIDLNIEPHTDFLTKTGKINRIRLLNNGKEINSDILVTIKTVKENGRNVKYHDQFGNELIWQKAVITLCD